MAEIILILGGARSGKSTFAERLAQDLGGSSVLYIATAEALDDEMRQRIAAHRAQRPAGWRTLEAPRGAGARVRALDGGEQVILLDCLTVWASNVLLALADAPPEQIEEALRQEVDALVDAARARESHLIIVSNEVGMGLVPDNALGRMYRDLLGRANQRLAQRADRVVFLVAGLPMWLKGKAG